MEVYAIEETILSRWRTMQNYDGGGIFGESEHVVTVQQKFSMQLKRWMARNIKIPLTWIWLHFHHGRMYNAIFEFNFCVVRLFRRSGAYFSYT